MLKLTKKADYGLISLRHLAVGNHGRTASAKDISDTYHIPLPILAKVLQKLAKAGLLTSEQGTNGGYRLSRPARDITTLEAIRTIDGPIILTACFTDHGGCNQSESCTVREPLRRVHEGILQLLANISIADMAQDGTGPLPDSQIFQLQPALTLAPAAKV